MLLIITLSSSYGFTPPNHSLFPLEGSAKWVYCVKMLEGSVTEVVKVLSVEKDVNRKVAVVSIKIAGVSSNIWSNTLEYVLKNGKIYEKWFYKTPTDVGAASFNLLLPGREVLKAGYEWTTKDIFEHESYLATGKGLAIVRHKVAGWEWVNVPAGKFYALKIISKLEAFSEVCLLYTSPSPRD